ncbi:hypothetical protein INS49_009074 [Diaporthe citri]|uniref:uncharacterized protein n=1 Tax=Diaporthe citri TaxID=83186 RepID=UPI001C80227E|nr:uncharacterized protein INS49_009074 [Diaporthe citri]KAG6363971.1 hypothetical protein INS49_009074 [Diaporthe citri]
MSSPKSVKSDKSDKSGKSGKSAGSSGSAASVLSIKSDISTMSADSFKAQNNLDAAMVKILDEQNIFAVRKLVSHNAKRIDPATAPAKNIRFADGCSEKMNNDHAAYKAEVDKINPCKRAYDTFRKSMKGKNDPELHNQCIKLAQAWCNQGVKAGKMRINFLKVHEAELLTHFSIKSTKDHIAQCEENLKSANKACQEIAIQEHKLAETCKRLAAAQAAAAGA